MPRGDLFRADIRHTTVVTLFPSPTVNPGLRPKLKPGSASSAITMTWATGSRHGRLPSTTGRSHGRPQAGAGRQVSGGDLIALARVSLQL